ncbi:SWIM zinc finger family protein, partial [Actinoplanes sp. NPDC026623]
MAEVVLAYDRPSRLDGRVLDLGRAAVPGPAPFFDGWVARPGLVAAVLLAVAAVARSRYFQPAAARLLDPVLTSGDGRLRLESFSSCGGVHARADLLPEALRDVRSEPGTTNVDLNREVRDALSRVSDRDELRLSVGAGGLAVVTRETAAFERRVTLPDRWLKGLGEAALSQAGMRVAATAGPAAARRLLA